MLQRQEKELKLIVATWQKTLSKIAGEWGADVELGGAGSGENRENMLENIAVGTA